MKLFIQIRNGQPYEHPIMEDNFKEAFPHIDVNNLPSNFARFIRVENPIANKKRNEVFEVSYQWVDGVVMDVWSVRSMTQNELDQQTQEMYENTINTVVHYREDAVIEFAKDNETNKVIWQKYIDALDEFSLTFTNPRTQIPPQYPIRYLDGSLMTTTDSGRAPNVIG